MCPKATGLTRPPFGMPAVLADELVPEFVQYLRLIEAFREPRSAPSRPCDFIPTPVVWGAS